MSRVYTQQLCRPSTTCYNSLLSPVCGLWLFVLLLVLQPAAERTTVVTFNKLKWTSVLNTMKNVHFVFPLHEEVIFLFRPTCEPISIWLVHSIIPVALCAVSFWDTSTSEWACNPSLCGAEYLSKLRQTQNHESRSSQQEMHSWALPLFNI